MERSKSNAALGVLDVASSDEQPCLQSLQDDGCINCANLQSEMKKLKEDHAMNFQVLKEKIIPTDSLIKKYVSKRQGYDNLAQKHDDTNKNLEKMQKECELLGDQLKKALQETEPLKKSKGRLEKTNQRLERELEEGKIKLQAVENLVKQYEGVVEEKKNEEKEDNLKQKRIRSLEDSNKKLENTLAKLKEESSKKSQTITEMKRYKKSTDLRLAKTQKMMKDMEIILKDNGLFPKGWKRSFRLLGVQSTVQENEQDDVDYMDDDDDTSDDGDVESCSSFQMGTPLYPALSPIPGSPRRKDENSCGESVKSDGQFSDAESSLDGLADMLETELSDTNLHQLSSPPIKQLRNFPKSPLRSISPRKNEVHRSPGGLRLLPRQLGATTNPITAQKMSHPKEQTPKKQVIKDLSAVGTMSQSLQQMDVKEEDSRISCWVPNIGNLSESESEEEAHGHERILANNHSCGFSFVKPVAQNKNTTCVLDRGDIQSVPKSSEVTDLNKNDKLVQNRGDMVDKQPTELSSDQSSLGKTREQRNRNLSIVRRSSRLKRSVSETAEVIDNSLKGSTQDSDVPVRKTARIRVHSDGSTASVKRITRSQSTCSESSEVFKEPTTPKGAKDGNTKPTTLQAKRPTFLNLNQPPVVPRITRSLSSPSCRVRKEANRLMFESNIGDSSNARESGLNSFQALNMHAIHDKPKLGDISGDDGVSLPASEKSGESDSTLVRRKSQGFIVTSDICDIECEAGAPAAVVESRVDKTSDVLDNNTVGYEIDNMIGNRRVTRLQAKTLQEGARKSRSPNPVSRLSEKSGMTNQGSTSGSQDVSDNNDEIVPKVLQSDNKDLNSSTQSSHSGMSRRRPESPLSSKNGSHEISLLMTRSTPVSASTAQSIGQGKGRLSSSPVPNALNQQEAVSPLPASPSGGIGEVVSPLPSTPGLDSSFSETGHFSIGVLNPLLSPIRDSAKLWPMVSPLPPSPLPKAVSPMSSTTSCQTPVHPSPHISFHSTAPPGLVPVRPKPVNAQRNLTDFETTPDTNKEVLQNVTRGNLSSQAAALQILRNQHNAGVCLAENSNSDTILKKQSKGKARKNSKSVSDFKSSSKVLDKVLPSVETPQATSVKRKIEPTAKEMVEHIVNLDKAADNKSDLLGWMAAVSKKKHKKVENPPTDNEPTVDNSKCDGSSVTQTEPSSAFSSYSRQDNLHSHTSAFTKPIQTGSEVPPSDGQSSKLGGQLAQPQPVEKDSSSSHGVNSMVTDYSDLMGVIPTTATATKQAGKTKSKKNKLKAIQNVIYHMFTKDFATPSTSAAKCSSSKASDVIRVILKMLSMCKLDMLSTVVKSVSSGTVNWEPVLNQDEVKLLQWTLCLVLEQNMVELIEEVDRNLPLEMFDQRKPLFGRLAICRFYTAWCRSRGQLEQIRVLVYDLVSRKPAELTCYITTIVAVWPVALCKNLKGDNTESPVLNVMEYIVMTKLRAGNNRSTRIPLDKLCRWQVTEFNTTSFVQAVFNRIKNNQVKDERCFEEQKAIELLSIYEEWEWCHQAIVKDQCLPVLSENGHEGAHSVIVCFAARLVGVICMNCPKNLGNVISPVINNLIAILQDGTPAIKECLKQQLSCAESLLLLSSFNPPLVASSLDAWMKNHPTETPGAIRQKLDLFLEQYRRSRQHDQKIYTG